MNVHDTTVRQSGNVTPTHITEWTTDGVVQDSGVSVQDLITMIGNTVSIELIIFGDGATIPVGFQADLEVPFNCTIQRATLLADQTGNIVVDVWQETYGNYPPTAADSITGGNPPTITGAAKSQNSTLTGWTKLLQAGRTLRYNVNSAFAIQRATLSLQCVRDP